MHDHELVSEREDLPPQRRARPNLEPKRVGAARHSKARDITETRGRQRTASEVAMNDPRRLGSRLSNWPIICLLALSTSGWSYSGAAPGDLVWEDTVGGSDGVSDAALAVSVFGAQVFAAGFIQSSASGDGPFVVRAYGARSGELIWADQPSSTGSEEKASDVDAFANEVAVCGVLDDGKFAGTRLRSTQGAPALGGPNGCRQRQRLRRAWREALRGRNHTQRRNRL